MEYEIWFYIFFCLSLIALGAVFVIWARSRQGRKSDEIPVVYKMIGVDFFALLFMFIPICYVDFFAGWSFTVIRPLLVAIHYSIQTFILNAGFEVVRDALVNANEPVKTIYTTLGAVLYVVSPLLTLGAVLSLFKYVLERLKLKAGRKKDTFVFSNLNERSLALARSIRNKDKKAKLIFAESSRQFCEDNSNLKTDADELNAICTEDAISEINLAGKKARLEFFVMGDDESQNVSETLKLTEAYKMRKNTKVFVFSGSEAVGIMLDSVEKTELIEAIPPDKFSKASNIDPAEYFILRRVDVNNVFANHTLANIDIFSKFREEVPALPCSWDIEKQDNPKDKVISVLIVGFGKHGKALFKMLLWYCQVKGYFLEVNVVERTEGAFGSVAGFTHECPGVMAVNNNRDYEGDARYSIKFFEGVDITNGGLDWVAKFREQDAKPGDEDKLDTLKRLRRTGAVFVTIGNDERNVGAAIDVRRLMDKLTVNRLRDELQATESDEARLEKLVAEEFAAEKTLPSIYAVVYDESKAKALEKINGLKHYNGNYDISYIGSLNDIYSYDTVFNEETELTGFKFHAMWAKIGEEKNEYSKYETYEYLRNSSLAQAIHKTTSVKKGFIRADASNLSEEDRKKHRTFEERSEHIRWCAYVRSVGYEYSGYPDKISRNDRAKWHHDLVPHALLSEEDKGKDVKILSMK